MKLSNVWIISTLCIFNTAVHGGIFSNRAAPGTLVDDANTEHNGSTNEKRRVVDKKMDYKLSFKKPYTYGNEVPFWSTGGDAIVSRDTIRISPSIPGARGWIWSQLENEYQDWMVEVKFRVSGNQIHGGRGMAFWYTKDRLPTGQIFGAQDQWNGLSIWFDTANPKTRHPTIMAFMNDGKSSFASPGVDPTKLALATCTIDYRNPTLFVKMRLTYKNKVLTMMVDNTDRGRMYRPCFQLEDISLPPGYHFGLTAASHNPADDHDIISFETFQLNPPTKIVDQKRPLEDEKIQKGEEFMELSEEQRKKIELAEAEIKRLREQGDSVDLFTETVATMGLLFDTERRILESLEINQLQLEAMGAPTAEKIISGDYVSKPFGQTQDGSNSVSIDDLRSETKLVIQNLEQQWKQRDQQLKSIQSTISQMEDLIQAMDKRMALQSNNLQGKLSEITKDSADAKGTMSSLIKYVVYACCLQGLVGIGFYIYWKLRVERNEKKFL